VPIKLAENLAPGPLELKRKFPGWSVKKSCVPGSSDVRGTLQIGSENKPSTEAARIAEWQKKLPKKRSRVVSACLVGNNRDR